MEKQAQTDRIRRMLTFSERVVPWLALVATPLGLFLVLRSQGEAIASLESIGWDAIVPSALAFMLAPLLQGVSFWVVLRLLTRQTPFLDAMVVWSRSYLVRYAPTGALSVAYRLSARRRLRASADQVLAAFAYEHVSVLLAAAAACLVLFLLAGDMPPLLPLAIALAALVLAAALQPRIAGRGVEAAARRLGLHLTVILEGRQLAIVVAMDILGWLGTGGAVYLLVTTVTGSSPHSSGSSARTPRATLSDSSLRLRPAASAYEKQCSLCSSPRGMEWASRSRFRSRSDSRMSPASCSRWPWCT